MASVIGERGYCLFVSNFNDCPMVHIRKFYQGNPTKYGIALTHREWRILMSKTAKLTNLIEQMQEAVKNGEKELESEKFTIGFRGIFSLISDFQGELYIHVRKFDDTTGLPTRKGVALTPKEFQELIDKSDIMNIDKIVEARKSKLEDANRTTKRKSTESSTKLKRKLFKSTV